MPKRKNKANDLFLLMLNLSQLSSRKKIIDVFLEATNEIWPNVTPRFSLSLSESENNSIEIATAGSHFGFISIENFTELESENQDLLHNACGMLAVILKKNEHEELIANEKLHLEKLVEERTQHLNEENRDRKRAEQALVREKYFLQKAQEIGHIGTWELDIEKNELIWTDENYRVFGLPVGTPLTYETFLGCVHPDDREYVDKEWKAAFDKKPYDIEHRLLVDGDIKWVREKAELHFNDTGKCIRGIGFTQDITDRKQAEEERQKFAMVADSSSEFIGMCDLNLKPVYVNPAGMRMVGLPDLEAACSVKVPEYFFPEDQAFIREEFFPRVLREGHGDVEIRLRHFQTGKPIWVFYYLFHVHDANGNLIGWATVSRDITEHKRAAEALQDSEDKFRHVFDHSIIGKSITFPSGEMEANKSFCDMLGYSTEEFLDLTWQQITYPDDVEVSQRVVDSLLSGEKDSKRFIKRYVHKDGSVVWADVSTSVRRDRDGRLIYFISTISDITDRKRAEKNLIESEKRYRALFENMTVGFVLFEVVQNDQGVPVDLVILAANDGFEKATGLKPAEVTGRCLTQILPGIEKDAADWIGTYGKVALTGESRQFEQGSELLGAFYFVTAYQAAPKQCCVTFQDITKRKRAEEERGKLQSQLIQAQKIESVGRLAGGVAHDYNNALSVIIGFTEMAMEDVDPSGKMHANLAEVLSAAKRSTNITRQLLAFARQQAIAPKVLDLNDTIENMVKMLQRLIGEDIDFAWIPGGKLWTVRIDPTQVDQILANLCVNARDAISDVGKVTIETKNMSFDESYCADHAGFIPGDYVMLAVSDDGSGMTSEILDNIFEPFFTTKALHQGTGLGLATVYGIVKQNNALINVYSELEKGTTIKIYLPRHTGQTIEAHCGTTVEIPLSPGESVLLVEDDRSILKLAKRILEDLGYIVLSANSPHEAANLAEAFDGEIDLLLTDVVMPGMNGRELSDQLKARYPNLKTLFMSGYTANVIAHRGVLEEGVCFMSKPFSKKDLAVKVREALDNGNV